MNLFVTGGTGLVGARLLPRLRDAGHDCRALVRPGRELPAGITPIEGDLLDPASLTSALEGVEAVIHLAALFRTLDDDAIRTVNLDGTNNLIAAVQAQAPAARVVMASTSNVYADVGAHPAREDDPTDAVAAYPSKQDRRRGRAASQRPHLVDPALRLRLRRWRRPHRRTAPPCDPDGVAPRPCAGCRPPP